MSDPSEPIEGAFFEGPKLYAAVGKIATLWSSLELTLDAALCEAARVDAETGFCMTSQIPAARSKLLALEALLALRGADSETLKSFRAFRSSLESTTSKRNRCVHDILVENAPNEWAFLRRHVDKTLVYKEEAVKLNDLMDIAREIASRDIEFRLLYAPLRKTLLSLR